MINFIGDNRYCSEDTNLIVTHDEDKQEAIKVSRLADTDKLVKSTPYHVVIIDEGQFFPDLFDYVTNWVDTMDIHVVVGGLSADSERRPFGDMLRLIPHADEFQQLTALCSVCRDGTSAQFSKFLGASAKQENEVAVGGADKYIPVCRRHFLSSPYPSPSQDQDNASAQPK